MGVGCRWCRARLRSPSTGDDAPHGCLIERGESATRNVPGSKNAHTASSNVVAPYKENVEGSRCLHLLPCGCCRGSFDLVLCVRFLERAFMPTLATMVRGNHPLITRSRMSGFKSASLSPI